MKNNRFKIYAFAPIIACSILVVTNLFVVLWSKSDKVILVATVGTLSYIVVLIVSSLVYMNNIKKGVASACMSFKEVPEQVLNLFATPYALIDTEGEILYSNYEMGTLMDSVKRGSSRLNDLIPNITKVKLPTATDDVVFHTEIGDKDYKVVLSSIVLPEFDGTLDIINEAGPVDNKMLISVYMYDDTEISHLRIENFNQQMIIGLLYIDNYDEVLDIVDEVKRSLLSALVDRKINKYMNGMDAVIKKLEKDKYLFVFQKKYLEHINKTSKSLLDEVKTINSGKGESVITISMGLGIAESNYARSYEYARAAIDLALGRGGDQVVIKDGDDITYIGGKSASLEKSTRVTARVKAHALRELIEAHDDILIMGHSIGDVDSLGSAIGVYKIAQVLGKKAHIVINEINSSIRPMITRFLDNGEYPDDMFVGSMVAQELARKDSLLVVVDVNRPSHTECPELFGMISTVIVLDHHRVSSDSVSNAVLSYIEPYASSASEMVAEVLQYIGDELKLKPIEAEALYAGIMIDTNNFLTKTGVRTFEAAAYLRKCGVDVTRIRKAFREDMTEYVTKAKAITSTEIFLDGYAFAKCGSEGVEAPTVLGAQVANELLEITGIKASFVFTDYRDKIFVSARSIDEVNVQVIMEKIGGGGHLNMAGAQLENVNIPIAMERVKNILSEMSIGGDL